MLWTYWCVWWCGYSPARSDVIQYIAVQVLGNATDWRELTQARHNFGACSDGIRAVFGGGAVDPPYTDTIDFMIIMNTAAAIDFGNLTVARGNTTEAASDGSRGTWCGGHTQAGSPTNAIDYNTIGSSGNSVDFGDLTVARRYAASCAGA